MSLDELSSIKRLAVDFFNSLYCIKLAAKADETETLIFGKPKVAFIRMQVHRFS